VRDGIGVWRESLVVRDWDKLVTSTMKLVNRMNRYPGLSRLAFVLLLLTALSVSSAAQPKPDQAARWAREAADVSIVRDDWGIAHINGKTDADAVFGMIYAQCEDDFNRVETNYMTSLGRTAEAEGESKIWLDLRMKLFMDPADLKVKYAESPEWLKKLMDAWADGINYYLAKHPEVKPRAIQRFEPWMALSFTEGSIGGDIERVDLRQLEAFYGKDPLKTLAQNESTATREESAKLDADAEREWLRKLEEEPSGSNGIAIAPANTTNHHSLLLINPHTSFFFRSELQMASQEGLNAYGAVTWGQFFIYQGFNERAGWMHTSSNVDAVDRFLESVQIKDGHPFYKFGAEDRKAIERQITVPYKTDHGMAERTFTAYFTHHGPVILAQNGKWESIELMQVPIQALEQSYLRTKARSYAEYKKTMELMGNSSNNTIFADADGDIAYWHGNYIPRRSTKFDYTKPVDGSDPDTDWKGLHTLDEVPHLFNPKSGYLFNVNNAPWWGAGESSLRKQDYPAYVEMGAESARGLHAIRVLTGKKDFTLESLLSSAFDSYLPWFDKPLPALLKAWDELPESSPQKGQLREQIAILRAWNQRWAVNSVTTSVAIFWGEEVRRQLASDARTAGVPVEDYAGTKASGDSLLKALAAASDKLTADFGTWKTEWGTINRFQRLTGDIVQPFNDAGASLPVPFVSSAWGSLASFGARAYPGTKKWYGTSGNSFVAVVEFGDKVRARAVTAGGESGHPDSKHFDDEAQRYASGNLRDVYFYKEQLKGHTEREYHPGQ
jgi:acyl-homoserine-lactone acylase